MARTKLAVLFGGASEEHPISVKSAQEVANSLDLDTYEPFYVGITQGGEWMLCDRPGPTWESGDLVPAVLSPDRGMPGLLVLEHGTYRTIPIDAVLPVLHGKLGEDGAVQGLLDLSGIPYVGCDVQSSVLCMDKSLAYLVVGSAGIATPQFRAVATDDEVDLDGFTYPVFVKPARSGSSFGVSRVDRGEDFARALGAAREYDSKVLVERAVVGSEVGCAVLETETGLIVGEVDQIRLSHGFFRIHQEDQPEIASENATIIVPADISAHQRLLVQETARAIFRALGCRGLARVDMFLQEDGGVVLNEVNTFPGMTSYSRYPRMMAAAGLPLDEVLDRLVGFALSGHRR
ncbi:MAG: D-alanine---(R)-lactate ligase [Actinomycetota bacterium]|jgi:D-alanine--(R)-lactate ligase|nr:D-alanine---(R)-lactate ligase [Actinomycetota bacterium]